jgi:hypothetical protein
MAQVFLSFVKAELEGAINRANNRQMPTIKGGNRGIWRWCSQLLKTGNLGRENVKSETTKTKVKYSK